MNITLSSKHPMKVRHVSSPASPDSSIINDPVEGTRRVDLPEAQVGPGEVLVRARATSLHFRDMTEVNGGYPRNDRLPTVPLSDAAGEVVEIGEGVGGWSGGAVTEAFLQTSLGAGVTGVLSEPEVANSRALVRSPEHLSFALSYATSTALNAMLAAGTRAGHTVLLLGTGGVSIFGLQLAKAMGPTMC